METVIGLLIWGMVGFLIYKLARKFLSRSNISAGAEANAVAEGGESTAGARADVGGIHIHLHLGDGHSLSIGNPDDSDAIRINPAELLRSGAIDGGGIGSVSDGARRGAIASGSVDGALPVNSSRRRRNNVAPLAVGE